MCMLADAAHLCINVYVVALLQGGGGREGFRSVCRNVGRANQIRAFKVIEYGYVKST